MKISTVLSKARALIENPEHWGTRFFSVDKNGHTVGEKSDTAYKFCARGALMRFAGYESQAEKFLEAIGGEHVGHFNNNATHEEVMMAFDFAILAAKDAGK